MKMISKRQRDNEVRRVANKLSYQGEALQRRIRRLTKELQAAKYAEREHTRMLLQAKLDVMRADDRLEEVLQVAVLQQKKEKKRAVIK